jgi:hypothetical protein
VDGGAEVDPDSVITARLRMDEACAQQIYDNLGRTLELMRQSRSSALSTDAASHVGKPN